MSLRGFENYLHVIILLVSLGLSAGGIWVAAFWWRSPLDGGKGGAIAVAISLIALFINRPYGAKIFNFLTRDREQFLERVRRMRKVNDVVPDERSEIVERVVEALVLRIDVEMQGQEKQNRFMAISAAIGTLTWGFGDWWAAWLQRAI